MPGSTRKARSTRYFHSCPPHHDPHAEPDEGLDGLLFNGQEIGAQHRRMARKQLERLRQRERVQDLWGALDAEAGVKEA